MPDTIPASTSTTSTIALGGTVTGTVDVKEDHDWYRISLNAGQSITITLSGVATGEGSLVDPYLNLRSSTGAILAWNDDSGGNRNAKIVFTATSSGTYYIDAGAWDLSSNVPAPLPSDPDYDPTYTGTGTYTLRVNNYVAPPVWNYDQIANQLVHGYWAADGGQSARHFNVAPGGTMTVNFGPLTTNERNLAENALAAWSDVIGITFVPVTSGGQIRFDNSEDPEDGSVAYSDGHFSNGVYTYADVVISTSWVNGYGNGLNSYGFQTYLHEIGHALGLGHAGNYNGDADYAADALYRNDAWSTSIMSYFDPQENSYFRDQGFTDDLTLTPMNGDIVAMQQMYGLSTITRTGDTTYGFNSNAGRAVYNASSMPNVAYTVFDSGGNDTLDYSGFSQNQVINLTAETFSNVGSGIGNVMIARGTLIENAVGGSGSDTINGNAAANRLVGNAGADYISAGDGNDFLTGGLGNDELRGGGGDDTFIDTRSSLNTDEIMDFGPGDRIIFTDAALSGFTFNLSGTTLTYSSGSLTFGSALSGTLIASAAATGGVQLAFAAQPPVHDPDNDFNGDGRSDILWRNDSGQITDWLATTSGGFTQNSANFSTFVATSWHVAGTGDFNGDNKDDILWRNDSGHVTNWLGTSTGAFTMNSANMSQFVATDWHIVGTGDFDGDGKDDVLWRNDAGLLTDVLGTSSGGFSFNGANATSSVATNWDVVGTGDFNGDGRDDILWRSDSGQITDWLGTMNGGFTINSSSFSTFVATNWEVVGTGDFNGDRRDDILWRSSTGQLTNWLGTLSGGFTANSSAMSQFVSTDWHVVNTGDFNGDDRDDILWRNDNGQVTEWLGTTTGAFVDNSANGSMFVPTSWHVAHAPDTLF